MDWLLILELFLYTVPVLILLTLQSDLGTALVFVAIYGGIVLLSGVSWKIILPVFLTGVLLLGGFLFIFISDGGRAFLHNGFILLTTLRRPPSSKHRDKSLSEAAV